MSLKATSLVLLTLLNFSNFNTFLNLESGHEIIGVTSTKTDSIPSIGPFKPDPFLPDSLYCNSIIIQAPIDDLKIKNGLNYDDCLTDLYINSNGSTTFINFTDAFLLEGGGVYFNIIDIFIQFDQYESILLSTMGSKASQLRVKKR